MPQKSVAPKRRLGAGRGVARLVDPDRCSWEVAVDRLVTAGMSAGFSQATVDGYRFVLLGDRLNTFRRDHCVEVPADLTRELVELLQAELRDAGLAPASVAAYARVVKKFLNFCLDRGLGVAVEATKVSAPKVPLAPYPVISEKEEVRLLRAAESDRDRMLVDLWLATGLRLGEMANVRLEHLLESPYGTYLSVPESKWGIGRVLPLDTPKNRVSARLERFIAKGHNGERRGPLWLSHRTASGERLALTKNGMKIIVRRMGDRAGVPVHPHLFRHTYATRAVRAGVGPLQLQRALGHRTLEMVNRYYRFDPTDLLSAWRRRPD
jgi:integrase/recombinase XerD